MINQLLAGVHIAAAAEAMALRLRAGVDPEQLYEVICNSAGGS
jgi:3-hydroxyisobutyrate dehydrogenase